MVWGPLVIEALKKATQTIEGNESGPRGSGGRKPPRMHRQRELKKKTVRGQSFFFFHGKGLFVLRWVVAQLGVSFSGFHGKGYLRNCNGSDIARRQPFD